MNSDYKQKYLKYKKKYLKLKEMQGGVKPIDLGKDENGNPWQPNRKHCEELGFTKSIFDFESKKGPAYTDNVGSYDSLPRLQTTEKNKNRDKARYSACMYYLADYEVAHWLKDNFKHGIKVPENLTREVADGKTGMEIGREEEDYVIIKKQTGGFYTMSDRYKEKGEEQEKLCSGKKGPLKDDFDWKSFKWTKEEKDRQKPGMFNKKKHKKCTEEANLWNSKRKWQRREEQRGPLYFENVELYRAIKDTYEFHMNARKMVPAIKQLPKYKKYFPRANREGLKELTEKVTKLDEELLAILDTEFKDNPKKVGYSEKARTASMAVETEKKNLDNLIRHLNNKSYYRHKDIDAKYKKKFTEGSNGLRFIIVGEGTQPNNSCGYIENCEEKGYDTELIDMLEELFTHGWWANVTPEDLKDAEKLFSIDNSNEYQKAAFEKSKEKYGNVIQYSIFSSLRKKIPN